MATREVRRKPLNLTKRQSRKLSSVHAYSRLYSDKWKDLVKARWKEFIAENPDKTGKKMELSIHNMVMKECLDAETDEIKAEVERKREQGYYSEDEDIDLSNEEGVEQVEQQRRTRARGFQKYVTITITTTIISNH